MTFFNQINVLKLITDKVAALRPTYYHIYAFGNLKYKLVIFYTDRNLIIEFEEEKDKIKAQADQSLIKVTQTFTHNNVKCQSHSEYMETIRYHAACYDKFK